MCLWISASQLFFLTPPVWEEVNVSCPTHLSAAMEIVHFVYKIINTPLHNFVFLLTIKKHNKLIKETNLIYNK